MLELAPHALRHAGATDAVAHKMPLEAVQRLLSHAALSTTSIYTRTDRTQHRGSRKAPRWSFLIPLQLTPNRGYTILQSCKPVFGAGFCRARQKPWSKQQENGLSLLSQHRGNPTETSWNK
jgi:hypothetical protein